MELQYGVPSIQFSKLLQLLIKFQMKTVFLYLVILITFTSCSESDSNNKLFDNRDLERAVRESLHLSAVHKIEQKDLDLITEITCTRWKDLSGLKYLRNLKEIYIVSINQGFTEISELKSIDILQITGCNIINLNFIVKSNKIRFLILDENNIKDISSIEKLKDLKEFSATHNSIKDITVLSKLSKLEYVNVYDNEVENLPDFSNCRNLKEINLQVNHLIYNNNFSKLKQVKKLRLSYNKINNIDWALSLDSIQELSIYNNPIDYNTADRNPKLKKLMNDDILHFDTKPKKISWFAKVVNYIFD